ncbi:hypothetical protein CF641_37450, partial [Burkholderia pseudomallei]
PTQCIVGRPCTRRELCAGEAAARLWACWRPHVAISRDKMSAADVAPWRGGHPIIPVIFGAASVVSKMADAVLAEGVYVSGFSFPVVPRGRAARPETKSRSHRRPQRAPHRPSSIQHSQRQKSPE